MRAYRKRFVKQAFRHHARQRVESRDAVVYSIDENNFYAEVKIQGSNELLRAHYPRNISAIPKWLKVGNSCRVVHKSGEGGYMEVVGPGRALPTPVADGDVPTPPSMVEDRVISGMSVISGSEANDTVYLEAGYYMIDGITYAFDPDGTGTTEEPEMAADSVLTMGQTVAGDYTTMGLVQASGYYEAQITTNPPSAGYFRYDAFAIGTDGVVDYLVGSNFSSSAVYPSIPADHVLIGQYILIIGGTSTPEISQTNIGQPWTERQSSVFATEYDLDEQTLAWSTITDYPTTSFLINFEDQYGWNYSEERSLEISMLAGSGNFRLSGGTYGTTTVQWTGTSTSLRVYYQREQIVVETNPVFFIQEITNQGISVVHNITLLDINGDPI